LKPNNPVIGVRIPNFFGTNVARETFSGVLQSARGKRMFTLTNREGNDEARAALAARGLSMGKTRAVSMNYFSDSLAFDVLLVEVLPSWQNNSAPTQAVKGLPLPDMAFKARLSVANMPEVMRSGQKYSIRVMLRNDSKVVWPGRQPTWQFQLTVGNRWLTEASAKVNDVDGRAALFQDLAPSETVEIPLTITAPNAAGSYILQFDAIQEGVAWFGDRGSEVLSLKVKVE
jgi:Ig-like domain from next to BRCA1 gene